ncbi:MAG: GvpL/GvpF family gas vesicle protein [Acidobacteria bacterium]|nr:GvpL/GvpF family gas vesicle protein [Acidobacteriota bacterium]
MTALYLYCIVKAARKPSLAGVPDGLPGGTRPEMLHVAGSIWLVATEVPLATYGSGHLDRHLADVNWVGRIALAHEAVVETFAQKASATVIPMKLFTMFSTRERAVSDISARRASIDASMRRIAGAEEWGIRIMRGEQSSKKRHGGTGVRATSGVAFLAAKKKARDTAKDARLAAAEAAATAFERLARLATDARRRDDAPAAGTIPPLLDAAFLVPSARRATFTQTARREAAACARAGAQMMLSGPWPAYNFVRGDERNR